MLFISKVMPGSIGAELGLKRGDAVTAVNDQDIRDILDYQFQIAGEEVSVQISRDGKAIIYDLEKEYDEDLGVEFSIRPRQCGNKCVFCFIDQQPRHLRNSLYIKDDDYRLSFLEGNYVTLTNLVSGELERIISERLSPLYISVHATDPIVRSRMLGAQQTQDIMKMLSLLAARGIKFHCQIVLCPGYNDGIVLARSFADLLELSAALLSLAVVPVGLTKFRSGLTALEPVGCSVAVSTIELINQYREKFRVQTGRSVLYAADELYLLSGLEIPPNSYYEDYPQLENGVGMVRRMLVEGSRLKARKKRPVKAQKALILTGTAASPVINSIAQILTSQLPGLELVVATVENSFLGKTITVAGLLAGRDIIARALESKPFDLLLVPGASVRSGCFLDDITIEQVQATIGRPVISAETATELYEYFAPKRRKL